MRPGILDLFGQRHGASFRQGGLFDVDPVEPQRRSEADVEECLAAHPLGHSLALLLPPGDTRRREGAGYKRTECPTIQHGRSLHVSSAVARPRHLVGFTLSQPWVMMLVLIAEISRFTRP